MGGSGCRISTDGVCLGANLSVGLERSLMTSEWLGRAMVRTVGVEDEDCLNHLGRHSTCRVKGSDGWRVGGVGVAEWRGSGSSVAQWHFGSSRRTQCVARCRGRRDDRRGRR